MKNGVFCDAEWIFFSVTRYSLADIWRVPLKFSLFFFFKEKKSKQFLKLLVWMSLLRHQVQELWKCSEICRFSKEILGILLQWELLWGGWSSIPELVQATSGSESARKERGRLFTPFKLYFCLLSTSSFLMVCLTPPGPSNPCTHLPSSHLAAILWEQFCVFFKH